MINIYQVLGIVKYVKRSTADDSSCTIKVMNRETQKENNIFCPFFCPVRKDDILAGICFLNKAGVLEFAQCPMVEPPSSKEAVQNIFIICMGKLRMSQYLSDQVYDFFQKDAIKRLENTSKISDKGSSDFTICRNRDLLNAAVIETISWYANNFRSDEAVAQPLINIGLSKDQACKLLRGWYQKFCLRRLYLLGLTRKEIRECCDRGWSGTKGVVNSPDALYYQLLENPFIPEKIPLNKAKDIASRYGITFNQDIIECASLIRFVDEQSSENSWSCYPVYSLMRRYPRFNDLADMLKLQFKCTIRYNFFYLRHQAEIEDSLVEHLKSEPLPKTHLSELSKRKFCDEQIRAIELALNNTVSVITGSAGTGKTHVISGLVDELDLREIPWCIGSFTGKAIANVKKAVGKRDNIMTLHMILSKGKIVDIFDRPVRVLIIDEISMIPNELISKVILKLSRALNPDQKLQIILVGDPNQVQPIECGDFTNQVLNSWIFEDGNPRLSIPWIQLTEDHRRKDKEGVLYSNMNQFATAERPEDINFEWGVDCEFISGGIVEIENCVRKLYEQGASSEDVTVISPINEGLDDINLRLRNIFVNPNAPNITDAFGKTWYAGDRVMMTVNRYDIKVMNGEEGIVTEILFHKSCIKVKFQNGQEVDIPTFIPVIVEDHDDEPDLEQPLSTKLLVLGWAITIHKSQGSQWKHVIFYIHPKIAKGSFLNRHLLYTGISRSQKSLTVVVKYETTFTMAILVNAPHRHDNLGKRLKGESFVDYYVDPQRQKQRELLQMITGI
jgi:hypothetical protein